MSPIFPCVAKHKTGGGQVARFPRRAIHDSAAVRLHRCRKAKVVFYSLLSREDLMRCAPSTLPRMFSRTGLTSHGYAAAYLLWKKRKRVVYPLKTRKRACRQWKPSLSCRWQNCGAFHAVSPSLSLFVYPPLFSPNSNRPGCLQPACRHTPYTRHEQKVTRQNERCNAPLHRVPRARAGSTRIRSP